MSRLTDLLRQARKADPQLGKELEEEFAALTKRRSFGLVFEQHQPEAVELPGRKVRRGDKVRVLPPRGAVSKGDQRLWKVEKVEAADGGRVAHLNDIGAGKPQAQTVLVEDLVVVAEFSDRVYPGLVETGRVERGGPDKPFHTVINAENYHALEMLSYTHRGKVDAIYIDPPYNTGAKDWKYNNDYVASDDDYRHSKWLAFMERRLEVARELLNPDDSVLIVTIDEKEYLRLGLLLEQVFPEAQIQMVTSVISAKGVIRPGQFARVEEYIFFVTLGAAVAQGWVSNMLSDETSQQGVLPPETPAPIEWLGLRRREPSSVRSARPNQFYPIFVSVETGMISGIGEVVPQGVDRALVAVPDGQVALWPVRPDGTESLWGLTPEVLRRNWEAGWVKVKWNAKKWTGTPYYLPTGTIRRIQSGEIVVTGHDEDGSVIGHTCADTQSDVPPKRVWNMRSHNAETGGTNLVSGVIPKRRFPFPKSLYAVEDALRFYLANRRNAVVLDFFSGSGTTAHAVMRLNRQDGGHRQCISVTNNEVGADEQKVLRKDGLRPGDPDWEQWGICEYITKPRVTAAITGKTPQGQPIKGDYKFTDEFPMADGFEENAAFFTLTYEDPLTVRHDRAFTKVAPMLWLRAGSQGRVITDLGSRGWDVAERYGVLKNMDQMAEFVAQAEAFETVSTVFVVTDSAAAFEMTCRELPARVTPVRLYESYLHNFAINRRAGA
ncbi:site-specific DNA-methyltransferase [Bacillus sp. BGMRC0062]|nr:site-specific DNA-methyltransferase [Bacillus sp. BGMRC0062]